MDSSSPPSPQFLRLADVSGPHIPDLGLTLWQMFQDTAQRYPEREAVVSVEPEARWTYDALYERASALAAQLSLRGFSAGMTIMAVAENTCDWALLVWACAQLELTFVPISKHSGKELEYMLSATHPHGFISFGTLPSSSPFEGYERERCGEFEIDINLNQPRPSSADHASLIIFTSGTTGTPKACPLTHRNLEAQLYAYDPNADPSFVDRWLVHTPTHHIFAINNAFRAWRFGDAVIFPSPEFNLRCTTEALMKEKCTVMAATPTLIQTLLSSAAVKPDQLKLSVVTLAGTNISQEVIRTCRTRLGAKDATQAYGCSEGAPLVSWSRQDKMLDDGYHPGTGKVLPGVRIRICDPDTGQILRRGDVGELHASGPCLIKGYLGEESHNTSFYKERGVSWYKTGDQARIDEDGVVYILGRYKDIIIRGGENISPAAVEEATKSSLGIDIRVTGIPCPIASQIVAAVGNFTDHKTKHDICMASRGLGKGLSIDEAYSLDELGLDSYPVTPLGKVKRHVLRRAIEEFKDAKQSTQEEIISDPMLQNLCAAWLALGGVVPGPDDDLVSYIDSITALKYCDILHRRYGYGLYLEDIFSSATLRQLAVRVAQTMAKMGQGKETYSKTVHAMSLPQPKDTAAPPQVYGLMVEKYIPIRSSHHFLVSGTKPNAYHIQLHFRAMGVHADSAIAALHTLVRDHDMLRADFLPDRNCHAILQDSVALAIRLISFADADLSKDIDPSLEEGFMFHAKISRDRSNAIVRLTFNHSIVDALSIWSLLQHLDHLLGKRDAGRLLATPYTAFANMYDECSNSSVARAALDFHKGRLRGISNLQNSLFPSVINAEADLRRSAPAARMARVVTLPGLSDLLEKTNLTPESFFRSALVLFNVLETNSRFAIFSSWESGRQWPFASSWVAEHLPSPMSIDGPTVERILNVYEVKPSEKLADLIHRIHAEQELAKQHAHVHWDTLLKDHLCDESSAVEEAMLRQSFVWDMSLGLACGQSAGYTHLEAISRHDWPDCGLFWNAYQSVRDSIVFVASWDAKTLAQAQISRYCDELAAVLRRLAKEDGWEAETACFLADLKEAAGECQTI